MPVGWRKTERGGGPSPFDVEISNGSRGVFIEVKSDSDSFYLTENEIAFASKQNFPYVVALVSDVGTDDSRSIRWIFKPLIECEEWIAGGTWLHYKEETYGNAKGTDSGDDAIEAGKCLVVPAIET